MATIPGEVRPYHHAINCLARSLNGPCSCGVTLPNGMERAPDALLLFKPTKEDIDVYAVAHTVSRQLARRRIMASRLDSAINNAKTVADLRIVMRALLRLSPLDSNE